MISAGSCLLLFGALSTHRLKYLGSSQMESAVLTVLNSDILPHVSTGAGTHLLLSLHAVNTRDVGFWALRAIPWIINVERLAPGRTLSSTGPIVKLGTTDILRSRSCESDIHWKSRSIWCFWLTVAAWSEPILPLSATNGLQSCYSIIPDL